MIVCWEANFHYRVCLPFRRLCRCQCKYTIFQQENYIVVPQTYVLALLKCFSSPPFAHAIRPTIFWLACVGPSSQPNSESMFRSSTILLPSADNAKYSAIIEQRVTYFWKLVVPSITPFTFIENIPEQLLFFFQPHLLNLHRYQRQVASALFVYFRFLMGSSVGITERPSRSYYLRIIGLVEEQLWYTGGCGQAGSGLCGKMYQTSNHTPSHPMSVNIKIWLFGPVHHRQWIHWTACQSRAFRTCVCQYGSFQ